MAMPVVDADPEFEALYDRHHAFVWRLLRRMGVPEEALDDATQDVFVVVHRRRDDLRHDVSVRSWLYGISRRVAADVHRRHRRVQRKLEALPAPRNDDPELDDQLARSEAAQFVRRFLADVDPGHRMVFVLADVEGLSAPEIAEALELNVNTVYSRLRTTRRRFERAVERRRARMKVQHG